MLLKKQRDAWLNKPMLWSTVNKLFLTRRRTETLIKKPILLSLTSQKNWINQPLTNFSQLTEQSNPANLRYSTMDQAEDSDTSNSKIKIALKQLSKLWTTLNKELLNKLSKSTFNRPKIPELPPMSKNSQTCSSATYQKTLLPINLEQSSLNSERSNPVKFLPRTPLKVSSTSLPTNLPLKLLRLSPWRRTLKVRPSWSNNTSTKRKVRSRDHPTKSPRTWATPTRVTSSSNTFQKPPLSTNLKTFSVNAVPSFQLSLRIISFMSRMRRSATTKKVTFSTRMSSKPKSQSRTTTRPTFLASVDQSKLISGDPRQILNNKMTLWPNKTFCNSLIFKGK